MRGARQEHPDTVSAAAPQPVDGACGRGHAGPLFPQVGSLVAQMVKNLPEMQETWVQSLGREDPLEKEMATHSSILAWRIQWTEEPGGLQSMMLLRWT